MAALNSNSSTEGSTTRPMNLPSITPGCAAIASVAITSASTSSPLPFRAATGDTLCREYNNSLVGIGSAVPIRSSGSTSHPGGRSIDSRTTESR